MVRGSNGMVDPNEEEEEEGKGKGKEKNTLTFDMEYTVDDRALPDLVR